MEGMTRPSTVVAAETEVGSVDLSRGAEEAAGVESVLSSAAGEASVITTSPELVPGAGADAFPSAPSPPSSPAVSLSTSLASLGSWGAGPSLSSGTREPAAIEPPGKRASVKSEARPEGKASASEVGVSGTYNDEHMQDRKPPGAHTRSEPVR